MKRLVPDEIILGILKYRPVHGYELLEYFRARSQLGRVWTMSFSQIYAVLKRLAAQGAILGHQVNVADAPARIEYHITALGDEQLETWLYEPRPSPSIHRIRVEFISRLYVAHLLNQSCNKIFENQIRECELQKRKTLAEKTKNTTNLEEITLDFVIGQLDAALKWLHFYQSEFSNKAKG